MIACSNEIHSELVSESGKKEKPCSVLAKAEDGLGVICELYYVAAVSVSEASTDNCSEPWSAYTFKKVSRAIKRNKLHAALQKMCKTTFSRRSVDLSCVSSLHSLQCQYLAS